MPKFDSENSELKRGRSTTLATRAKRMRVRRREPGLRDCFDVLRDPNLLQQRGSAIRPFEDELLVRQFERASRGSLEDLRAILLLHDENRHAKAWCEEQFFQAPEIDCYAAMEACLILDIFRVEGNDHILTQTRFSQRTLPGDIHRAFRLANWSVAALEQYSVANTTLQSSLMDWIERPPILYTGEFEHSDALRWQILAELRKRRQRGGRYAKGESGNLFGRAGSRTNSDIPYPWLEEILVLELNGVVKELTRCEALIMNLHFKARADARLAQGLSTLLASRRNLARRFETSDEQESREAKAEFGVRKVLTIYDAMRVFRMISLRAKRSVLLMPDLIERALGRLQKVLDPYEQRVIVKATSRPYGEFWPEWWLERPDPGRSRKSHLERNFKFPSLLEDLD